MGSEQTYRFRARVKAGAERERAIARRDRPRSEPNKKGPLLKEEIG